MYFNFKGAPNATFLNTYLKPQLSLIVTSGTLPTLREWCDTYETDTKLRKLGAKEYGTLTRLLLGKVGAWESFSPTWDPAPSAIGNGTLTAYYNTFYSRFTVGFIQITAGSTTAFGATQWGFSLPATATVGGIDMSMVKMAGTAYDASAAKTFMVSGTYYSRFGTAAKVYPVATQSTSAYPMKAITASAPFTWTTSDVLTLSFMVDKETF